MGKHFRRCVFYGAGEFAKVDIDVYFDPSEAPPWGALCDTLAEEHDLVPDALGLIEAMWGGPDGEDEGAELVTYEGRLIGSFGRPLTDAEFALLLTIPHFGDVEKTTDAERATPMRHAAE